MTLNDFIPFDPSKDSPRRLPQLPGNYFVLIRDLNELPNHGYEVTCKVFNGLNVIYTGISQKNLYNRIWKNHFGNVSGNSTLRQSLGCLFGYKQTARNGNKQDDDHIRFSPENEAMLTGWMKKNLIFFFLPYQDYSTLESALIRLFNPPLNLEGNLGVANAEFRACIQVMRSETPWQTKYQKVQALLKKLNG